MKTTGTLAFVSALIVILFGCTDPERQSSAMPEETEARIVRYLADNTREGQVVVVSELYNDVFTSSEERVVLDRLFNSFFKIPMFLVQFQNSTGRAPSLDEIAGQFGFEVPGEADVMLRVMEADPRIPTFFDRDPVSGEITRIDIDEIRDDPQFSQDIERSLAGWENRLLPPLEMETFEGGVFRSADLAGRPYLVYVWFTNCPPCVQTSPILVRLYDRFRDEGFEIVAANADRMLQLPYDDQTRSDYVEELGIRFVTTHLTEAAQNALGGVTVFPTMFFVDRDGVVVRHFMNFQEEAVLEEAIRETL